jgi:uncharacterized protein (TIGR03118 family)
MTPKRYPFRLAGLILLTVLIVPGISCKKNNAATTKPAVNGNYQQTNLVSDTVAFAPARIDPTLTNAWGLAINPKGIMWISENGPGMTAVYDTTGKTLLGPVGMPFEGTANGSFPSGIVFNPTTSFTIPPPANKPALFIWATENGSVATWAGGDTTTTVIDNSAQNSVYKGLAIASNGGANYLYVADFHNSKVSVFDQNFNPVPNITLTDPGIPANFGPFNIACFGNQLYVTYAAHKGPDNHDDAAGAGNGYIDVFSPGGTLVKRFATQGPLNSPWGLAQAPDGFGVPFHSILVGNFGDGRINVYDSTGAYLGPLQSNGSPLSIDGLWALEFGASSIPGANPNKLYFTAGPMGENHGLFGFLQWQQ